MRFPQTLPDIRDEMQKLSRSLALLLDPETAYDLPKRLGTLDKVAVRLAELTSALTEAIVDQARI